MAVINRTDDACSPRKSIRIPRQGIILVLVLIGVPQCAYSNPPQPCEAARNDLAAVGFPASAALDRPTGGPICGEDSCCGHNLEQDLLRQNKHQVNVFLRDSISKLSSVIDMRARKFDGLFREMMNTSKREFHEMFHRTYGKIYLQNSDVFSDFFGELETYYKKGTTRLSYTLENFFGVLYQRMFTVLNSQYSFDDKYLECVSEHMIEMKPFGDVPHKLTLELRRSFVATRTYYKALSSAAEATRRMMTVKIDEECERDMMKMQSCGSCRGLRGAGVCSNYCAVVLESCLRHHTAFSSEWDTFIDALDKVADRLVGPYNIEMVVEPLNIKISEAIMNFQDNGLEISKKIHTLCGKPTLRRRRRASDGEAVEDDPSFEIKYEPMKMNGGHKKKKSKKVGAEDNGSILERLIKDIKTKIRETRQFWAHLPYQYCNNESITAPPSSNGNCWNGSAIGDFTKTVTKPVVKVSPIVSAQTYSLQVLSDNLRKAYHGDEVEIIDDSEDNLDGSGSGSGDFEIDEENEEEGDKVEPEKTNEEWDLDKNPQETPTSSTTKPEDTKNYSAGASTMSLNKALVQYLLPIVLVWFGGAISDLL